VKEIKKITSKRKKTDEDYEKIAELEWYGGLYIDDGKIVVPGENIEAMIVAAAKKNKLGKQFTAGLMCDGSWPLIYDGPKNIDKLWENERYRLMKNVRVGQAKVMRCRPIFRSWKLEFELQWLPELINEEQIDEAVVIAGRIIGLCDWKPKFGRFEIIE